MKSINIKYLLISIFIILIFAFSCTDKKKGKRVEIIEKNIDTIQLVNEYIQNRYKHIPVISAEDLCCFANANRLDDLEKKMGIYYWIEIDSIKRVELPTCFLNYRNPRVQPLINCFCNTLFSVHINNREVSISNRYDSSYRHACTLAEIEVYDSLHPDDLRFILDSISSFYLYRFKDILSDSAEIMDRIKYTKRTEIYINPCNIQINFTHKIIIPH